MKSIPLKFAASLLLPAALAACALVPDAPNVVGTPLPEGTPVALGQPVKAGAVVAMPIKVIEDSRCPVDVQCAWAGRLVVETRIDGAGWRDTANINLGESYGTHGTVIELVEGRPARSVETDIRPDTYRFIYASR